VSVKTEVEELDDDARIAANKLRRSIIRMARRMRVLRADHGISGSKLSILGRLYRAGRPMTATDLARLERLQPQSLTRIISDLDEKGLIQRRPDDVDRRQLLIETTQRGTELLVMDAYYQNTWLVHAMETKLSRAERGILYVAADLLDGLSDEDDLAASELMSAPLEGDQE
jgi:DNA-binding MarR family transcriptional regulator